MTRRPFIPQKRPIYIGCEGESEAAYASLLQAIAIRFGLNVYINIHCLGQGAGDPLSRLERAIKRLKRLDIPRNRYLMLDTDQLGYSADRTANTLLLARKNNITIIWQRPCFEAMLLRHLPSRATNLPHSVGDALQALKREWPEYRKGMPRLELERRIDRNALEQAASIEPELFHLLRCIGLV